MNNEEWYVILNMNCKYEICRMCPKSGLFKGTYKECEKWIDQKKKEEMKEKSILEMVGGEKYINPHYNIKVNEKKDEIKNRISMALKDSILQQGFEIICKENAELEKENKSLGERCLQLQKDKGELTDELTKKSDTNHQLVEQLAELNERCSELEKENAELRKVAEFQQSSNMNTHFENKKLKEGLAVGSIWNKHLNSQNKALEEERDRYRNMTFDQREHLTKAKEIIDEFVFLLTHPRTALDTKTVMQKAQQFLSEVEK